MTISLLKSMGLILGMGSIVAVALTAQAQKKGFSITTTEFIDASKQEVFNLLVNFERFSEWSPFLVADPGQKNNVTGQNGRIGSKFHWEGTTEKSKGYQTLAKVGGNSYIRMECVIVKPFEATPTFEYHLEETNGRVKVVQEFNNKMSGFPYFMARLFGAEKQMRETNKLGMARLKATLEKSAKISSTN